MAWDVGPQGDTRGHRCQAEFCHRGCTGKSSGAAKTHQSWAGNSFARSADAAGAQRVPEGGGREVVAHHQSGQHQRGMSWTLSAAGCKLSRQPQPAIMPFSKYLPDHMGAIKLAPGGPFVAGSLAELTLVYTAGTFGI